MTEGGASSTTVHLLQVDTKSPEFKGDEVGLDVHAFLQIVDEAITKFCLTTEVGVTFGQSRYRPLCHQAVSELRLLYHT